MSNKTLATMPTGLTSVFNDFFEPWNGWFGDVKWSKALTVPKANVAENKDSYTLSLGAPGLQKKDFDISVEGNILTVKGEHETNKEQKDEKMHRQEYNYSSFSRSFTLPEGVAADKIDATYDGGVLKVVLPKTEVAKSKPSKTIAVN